MTYGELKEEIRDLGFEEDSTMEEYSSIVRNACNRAIQFIFDDMVMQLKAYYKQELSTEDNEWKPVRPTRFTVNSPDSEEVGLPDNLLVLVPLLAAYNVFLDDDTTKCAYYWNEYDEFRTRILQTCMANVKAQITGGISWVDTNGWCI